MKKLISLFLSLSLLSALPSTAYVDVPALALLPETAESLISPILSMDREGFDAALAQSYIDMDIQAAGGTPGQLNVMINGRCVPFAGAAPEAVNSRTMVPLRAAMEAMGAKVDYDAASNTAKVTLEDLSFTNVIGTDTLTLANGSSLQMDVASYSKNNRTMVPLRFFSQALNCDVYWDSAYNTAVVVEKNAFIRDIDSRFTILNSVMQKQNKAIDYTRNLQCDASLSGAFTLIDTISGNTDYSFSAAMTALIGKESADLQMSMDLSFLSQILERMEDERPQWVDGLLKNLSLRMICSESTAWFNSPALFQAMREDGVQLPNGDIWLQLDGLDEMTAMPYLDYVAQAAGSTLGETAYLAASSLAEPAPFNVYSQTKDLVDIAALLFGDSTWIQEGSAYHWHMDMDSLTKLVNNLSGEDAFFTGSGIAFNMDITVLSDGACTFTLEGSVHSDALDRDVAKLTASGSSTAVKSEAELRLQVINICDLTLQSSGTATNTNQTPASQPPAGAVILDENYPLPS